MTGPFTPDANTVLLWNMDDDAYTTSVAADAKSAYPLSVIAGNPMYCLGPAVGRFARHMMTDHYMGRASADAGLLSVFVGDNWTVDLWARLAAVGEIHRILTYAGGATDETSAHNIITQLRIRTDNKLETLHEYSAGTNVYLTQAAGSALSVSTWYHLAWASSKSGGNRVTKFYINGSLQDTQSGTMPDGGGSARLTLCRNSYDGSGYSNVSLAYVHVSNIERGAAYLAANYAAIDPVQDANTVAMWGFQDAPPVADASDNGHHLTTRSTLTALKRIPPIVVGLDASKWLVESDTGYNMCGVDWRDASFQTLAKASAWTIDVWLTATPLDTTQIAPIAIWGASGDGTPANNYLMRVIYDMNARTANMFWEYNAAGADVSLTSDPLFAADDPARYQPFLLTITKHTDAGTIYIRFYCNGVFVSQSSTANAPHDGAATDLRVGYATGGLKIGPLRWSDIRRTDEEILAGYTSAEEDEAIVWHYRMRGYRPGTSDYESWVALGAPNTTNPSLETIQDVTVVAKWPEEV